jgi:hypothetical protein
LTRARARTDHASNIRPQRDRINTPIDISANVSGSNIGHIKLFVGYFDPASNSLNVTDSDFLESDEVREVSGGLPGWRRRLT